jgi:hypothetical protein
MKDGERFEQSLTKIAVGKLPYKELIKKTELTEATIIRPELSPLMPTQRGKGERGRMGKPIYQLKNTKIIAQYQSIKEAAEITGINVVTISKVLRGIKKSTHGFVWQYA